MAPLLTVLPPNYFMGAIEESTEKCRFMHFQRKKNKFQMWFLLEALPVEDDTEAEKSVEEDKVYLGNNTGPLLIYFDSVHAPL